MQNIKIKAKNHKHFPKLTLACRVDCNGTSLSGSEGSFCPGDGVGGLFGHDGRWCFNSVILRKRFKQPPGHSV